MGKKRNDKRADVKEKSLSAAFSSKINGRDGDAEPIIFNNANKQGGKKFEVRYDSRYDTTSDPRFKKLSFKKKKIQLDERFSKILKSNAFKNDRLATVDPYGRPREALKSQLDDLSSYYYADEDATKRQNEGKPSQASQKVKKLKKEFSDVLKVTQLTKNIGQSEDTLDPSENAEEVKERYFAVGNESKEEEEDGVEDLSEGESSDSSENKDDDANHLETSGTSFVDPREAIAPSSMGEEFSSTLAVLGCNWDVLSATDIMMIFQSFVKANGLLQSRKRLLAPNSSGGGIKVVSIYPSEYGQKQLELEHSLGPSLTGLSSPSFTDNKTVSSTLAALRDPPNKQVSTTGDRSSRNEEIEPLPTNSAALKTPDFKESASFSAKVEKSPAAEHKQGEEHTQAEALISSMRKEELQNSYKGGKTVKPVSTAEHEAAHQEELRNYQKQRMMYYFAVVECDSIDVAVQLYDELNEMETDFCPEGLDIRFVAPGTKFPNAPVSVAKGVPKNYALPASFTTSLRHSKASCHWDETPIPRMKMLSRRFKPHELESMDLDAYLASDASESTDDNRSDEEDGRNLEDSSSFNNKAFGSKKGMKFRKITEDNLEEYRKTILGDDADKDDNDYIIQSAEKKSSSQARENMANSVSHRLFKPKSTHSEGKLNGESAGLSLLNRNLATLNSKQSTDIESSLQFKSSKSIQKKQSSPYNKEEDTSRFGEDISSSFSHHVNEGGSSSKMKKKKKGKKLGDAGGGLSAGKVDAFEINPHDNRFGKLFTDPEFAIDPTNPNFKKSAANDTLINEKLRRRNLEKIEV